MLDVLPDKIVNRHWFTVATSIAMLASVSCDSGCGRSGGNDAAGPATLRTQPGSSTEYPMAGSLNAAERIARATELMNRFAERTGITSDAPQRRYLWTDAFAVCNFLGLAHSSNEQHYTDVALRLVDRVHETLGRHRPDDGREGFLSRLTGEEAREHPTTGGLRIGKALPERGASDRFDERLEWDRDGQYFHYIAQWMHALDQAAERTRRAEFNRWARELGAKAFDAFTYVPAGASQRRMYWKMSIDLSRPLVASMGQQDPLDGYVTSLELQSTAKMLETHASNASPAELATEATEYASMVERQDFSTTDPLGLGGLLIDTFRLVRLPAAAGRANNELVQRLLEAATDGIAEYAREDELNLPAERRLAFRELGLSIGLHAVAAIEKSAAPQWHDFFASSESRANLKALMRFESLAAIIETFWLEPSHEAANSWTEHRDINDVMLATSLVPAGYLGL